MLVCVFGNYLHVTFTFVTALLLWLKTPGLEELTFAYCCENKFLIFQTFIIDILTLSFTFILR